MKVVNFRSEDLVERFANNDLTEDAKYIIKEISTPKI